MNEFAAKQIEENKKTHSPFLDLGQCSLTAIPKEIASMPWIERLNLGSIFFNHASFRYQPSTNKGTRNELFKAGFSIFSELPNLKGLYVSGCSISDFSFLVNLPQLCELDLNHEKIDGKILISLPNLSWLSLRWSSFEIENFLGNLQKLEFLDLSYGKLTEPSIIKRLKNLKSLFLHSSGFEDISFLKSLNNLEFLDIHRNNITDYSPLTFLKSLRRLDISENKFVDLKFFDELAQLEYLNFSENRLDEFSFLRRMHNLTGLNLGSTDIKKLEQIIYIPNLNELYLSNNGISDISFLAAKKNLEVLDLASNIISDLSALTGSSKLKSLDISRNRLTSIEPLKHHKELRYLKADENSISDISLLKTMTKLVGLSISSNQLMDTNSLLQLKDLIAKPDFLLNVSSNPFLNQLGLTLEPLENHRESILSVLSRLSEEKQYDLVLPVKVVLLGNSASGKTSLLYFIKTKKLKEESKSTHVINIERYPANCDFPKAIFFDFGGQDYYHGIYRAFLTDGSLIIILWNNETNLNVTNKDNNVPPNINYNLDYWIGQRDYVDRLAKSTLDSTALMIVQSHAAKDKRHSGSQSGLNLFDQFYLELKATGTNQNHTAVKLDEMKASRAYFKAALHSLIENMQVVKREPKWYIDFIRFILETKLGPDIYKSISLQEVQKNYGDKNFKFIKENLDQLHKKGLILYYRNELPECVWLNPEALVKYVHEQILTKDRLIINKGKLPASELDKYDQDIVRLLTLQKVFFRHNGDYIIPNYLPLAITDKDFSLVTFGIRQNVFFLRFSNFIPFGLINQLICFHGRQALISRFWRDQVLFSLNVSSDNDSGKLVLITLKFEDLELKIQCTDDLSNDEKQYVFYTILSLYWNQEPVFFNDFTVLKSVASDTDTSRSGSPPTNPIQELFNNPLYFPVDLHISVNGEDYMRYSDLIKIPTEQTKLSVYSLLNNKIDITKAREVALNIFQPFTLKSLRKTKSVFISYSHIDKEFRDTVLTFLINLERDKLINIWQDGLINPGDQWDEKIKSGIENADIILLLVSQDFINSTYVHEVEMKRAVEKAQNKTAQIIPFLLRSCDWKKWKVLPREISDVVLKSDKGVIGRFQFLPLHETDKRGIVPLLEWDYRENAWMQLVDFIRRSV